MNIIELLLCIFWGLVTIVGLGLLIGAASA